MAMETECKIHINNVDEMKELLEKAGAAVTKPRVYEHNLRFASDHHEFLEDGIVLRLRKDRDIRITYKQPAEDVQTGAKTRLELETTVGDFEVMQSILEFLGFRPYMVYEKYRTTYHFPDIENTEVVVDEMPFGNFIEIEGEGIEKVVERLHMQDQPRILESYNYLFKQVKSQYELEINDLTFANFEALDVDPSVFQS